jgi:hypothetical protein
MDVVDRLVDGSSRMAQHLNFLRRMDELTDARETHAGNYQELLDTFVADFISARPVEQIAFSSSLSGRCLAIKTRRKTRRARCCP